MSTKQESLHALRTEFDAFTQKAEASRLPDQMKPSAVLMAYDPLLSQGTFRFTGDPHAVAQTMLHALRDPANKGFQQAFFEAVNDLVR